MEIHGQEFKLHAAVMSNGSRYFATALGTPHFSCAWNKKTDGKYFLKFDSDFVEVQFVRQAFNMVVDFIYSGSATVSEAETIEMTGWTEETGPFMHLECDILKLADFFQMDWMLSVYTTIFQKRLTPTTVLEKLSYVCQVPGLKEARRAAIDYLVENIAAVQVDLLAVRQRAFLFRCTDWRAVQEQDPVGWANVKNLKRAVQFQIINALAATKKEGPRYVKGPSRHGVVTLGSLVPIRSIP